MEVQRARWKIMWKYFMKSVVMVKNVALPSRAVTVSVALPSSSSGGRKGNSRHEDELHAMVTVCIMPLQSKSCCTVQTLREPIFLLGSQLHPYRFRDSHSISFPSLSTITLKHPYSCTWYHNVLPVPVGCHEGCYWTDFRCSEAFAERSPAS